MCIAVREISPRRRNAWTGRRKWIRMIPAMTKRLEMLKGKIDEGKFNEIASRFTPASKPAVAPAHEQEATLGASTLQDLMLQAEILVQYGMRNKAVERLQRIQELFPREEERNEDLQRLYLAAGVTPSYSGIGAAACGGYCRCAGGGGSGDGRQRSIRRRRCEMLRAWPRSRASCITRGRLRRC